MTGATSARKITIITGLLGFVAGYCDTVGFIALSGLFVAHVTGNLVLAGANLLAARGASATANLVMLPVFLVAIGLLTVAAKTHWFLSKTVEAKERMLLALQALFTCGFWAVGSQFAGHDGFPLTQPTSVIWVGGAGVLALAVQNAFTRLSGSTMPATTVMTGNLTQAAVSGFAWLVAARAGDKPALGREVEQLRQLTPSVLGFFVGAAVAAPLTYLYRFNSLAIPVLALVLALLRASPTRASAAA